MEKIDRKRSILRRVTLGESVLSVQDAVYISMSNLNDDSDIERVRLKVMRYRDAIRPMLSADEARLLGEPTHEFASGVKISIEERKGLLYFLVPVDDRLLRNFKSIKGWRWSAPYHVFPAENGVLPLKVVEDVFNVYIDYENPRACFGAINVIPETRSLRLVVFSACKATNDLLNSSKYEIDTANGTYEIKVENLDELQQKMNYISSTGGRIRLLVSAPKRIEEMKDRLIADAKHVEYVEGLSRAGSTHHAIRSPEGLVPYPYQIAGVEFIEKTNVRTLIADEMGLGKTVEACLYIYNHPNNYPAIIVVPSSVKINWIREIVKWCSLSHGDVQIVYGAKKKEDNTILPGKKAYIINYDILSGRLNELRRLGAKLLVLDEAHYIKNHNTLRAKSCFELSSHIPHVLCLTGTPIVNRPSDLWSIIVVTKNAGAFGGFWNFTKRYCDAIETKWGWKADGASNLEELQSKMRQRLMLRRSKSQVLTELPPKIRVVIPVEISNRSQYDAEYANFSSWYADEYGKDGANAEALVKIEKMKQLIYKGKRRDLVSFIRDTAENYEKILVFFSHKAFLAEMREELKRDFTLDALISEFSAEERQEIVDFFNEKDRCILLCSTKVAREGLNLQTAQVVIFAELEWTSTMHDQAEDRAHRIGHEGNVNVYYIVAENTIEERIIGLLNKKQSVIDGSVGDPDVTNDFLASFRPAVRDPTST